MKNTFGSSVSLTLFGESHGPEIGAVLDGLAPGIPVDKDYIAGKLLLRRPAGSSQKCRIEVCTGAAVYHTQLTRRNRRIPAIGEGFPQTRYLF